MALNATLPELTAGQGQTMSLGFGFWNGSRPIHLAALSSAFRYDFHFFLFACSARVGYLAEGSQKPPTSGRVIVRMR